MNYRKYRIVIEINVPDDGRKPDSFFDEFSATIWGSAMLETTYARIGGPKAHPYSPRVVESYDVTGSSAGSKQGGEDGQPLETKAVRDQVAKGK